MRQFWSSEAHVTFGYMMHSSNRLPSGKCCRDVQRAKVCQGSLDVLIVMQCIRGNAAMESGLTSLPPAEEINLVEQANVREGVQFSAVTCGSGNAGGVCVITTLAHDIKV
jgi:hypothetical protein